MRKLGFLSLILGLTLAGCKPATEASAPATTDSATTTEATTAGEAAAPTTEGSAETTP